MNTFKTHSKHHAFEGAAARWICAVPFPAANDTVNNAGISWGKIRVNFLSGDIFPRFATYLQGCSRSKWAWNTDG